MTDLREHLSRLLAPAQPGDEIAAGLILRDVSTEGGLRAKLGLDGGTVDVELAPVADATPHAARTKRFLLSYRTGEKSRPVEPDVGLRACDAVAALVASNEDRVVSSLESEARAVRESSEGGLRIRHVQVSRALDSSGTPADPYYLLNPYVGCLIGCRFCYAQAGVGLLRRLQGLAEVPWGSYVDVRVNLHQILARELDELDPLPVKFCPIVSDPYQAVERKERITRRCLEVMAQARRPFPPLVLTRSAAIVEDAPLLASIDGAWAGVSLPTIDDEVRRHFEPRGAPVQDRLRALQVLKEHGVRTFAIIQPMLPGSPEELADALASRVASVRLDVLYGVQGAEREFSDARWAHATEPEWQQQHLERLTTALAARGIATWPGELPPLSQRAPGAAPLPEV